MLQILIMRNHTLSGNEVSTGSEPYTLRVEMRVVDPTLPRYGTDLMTLQNELLHSLGSWWMVQISLHR
jgi:hypothetical protein